MEESKTTTIFTVGQAVPFHSILVTVAMLVYIRIKSDCLTRGTFDVSNYVESACRGGAIYRNANQGSVAKRLLYQLVGSS